ncbi:HEPN domain-containing protein [Candidatus Woesearchaeota archaeon]|nr:HEPN domain-containing protein [Candidatus Woesearchaeota archaeon]
MEERGIHRGLVKKETDIAMAEKHLRKAEHNLNAATYFDEGGYSDWSASAFFYCIYHCFLAIVRKFGYESRNQECTIAFIEMLKEKGEIDINDKFINMLKIANVEEIQEGSLIQLRESFQYGVEIEFKEKEEFNRLNRLCKEFIDVTKEIIHDKNKR